MMISRSSSAPFARRSRNEQSLKLLTAIQQRMVTCKEMIPETGGEDSRVGSRQVPGPLPQRGWRASIIDFLPGRGRRFSMAITPRRRSFTRPLWRREDKAHDRCSWRRMRRRKRNEGA